MITTGSPFVVVLMLAAAVFPLLARRFRWRVFVVLPPIVLTYLFITALAVAGMWQPTPVAESTKQIIGLADDVLLVPIAVLLALLGLVLGTGIGLFMATVLSALAPA